jgi:hypothetical protein
VDRACTAPVPRGALRPEIALEDRCPCTCMGAGCVFKCAGAPVQFVRSFIAHHPALLAHRFVSTNHL